MSTTSGPITLDDHPQNDAAVLEVHGGTPLRGEVGLPGAKNAALPLIVAACLSEEPSVLDNVPLGLNDVRVLIRLLRACGARVDEVGGDRLECAAGDWRDTDLRGDQAASRLRHSLLLLGAAAASGTRLALPLPGGCQLGDRRHDLHLYALNTMGFDLREAVNELGLAPGRPGPETSLDFRYPTFGGTLNVLFAAATWPGTTTRLRNAARNPEVEEVIRLLNSMGAKVTRPTPGDLVIRGVPRLHGVRHVVMPDRIVAATLIAATAITGGHTRLEGASLEVLESECATWRRAGISLRDDGGAIEVGAAARLRATDVVTRAYPGFHTDIQPLHAAMMCLSDGISEVRETILDGRFAYARGLAALGADVEVRDGGFTCVNGAAGQVLRVRGVSRLRGNEARMPDIRGGGALVVAALAAEGTTRLTNLYQLERGYRGLPDMLTALGARVARLDPAALPA